MTAFRYIGQDESYGVNVLGKRVNIEIDMKHVKADVTWDPEGVEFEVNLILGRKEVAAPNLYNSLPS